MLFQRCYNVSILICLFEYFWDDSQKKCDFHHLKSPNSGFCALFFPQISPHEDVSEDDESLAELPLATHPAVPAGLARSQLGVEFPHDF